jgi:hypothetical protein
MNNQQKGESKYSLYKEEYIKTLEECLYDILIAAESPEKLVGIEEKRSKEIYRLMTPLLNNGPSKICYR